MKEQGSIEENFDFSKYGFRHINKAVLESIYVVNKHKKGQVEYLPTKWKKLNSNLLGGLQKGKLYVVAGRPGSGKSAFSNQLVFDMMDMNLGKNIVVLYWNFEMPSYQQVLRMISKNVSKSMNQLLSVDTTLADQDFIAFTKAVQRYKDYPVYFNDIPRSIDFIKLTNEKFYKSNPKTTIVNIYDHTRLVRSNKAGKELERLTELSHTCMELQAKYKVINILLSQLNRNIEKDERRATLFQPMLSDLFGSDSIGQDISQNINKLKINVIILDF